MHVTQYCYSCKGALPEHDGNRCPHCGERFFPKSEVGKGLVSILFSTFFLMLGLVGRSIDRGASYMCLAAFVVFLWIGIHKILKRP